MLKYTAQPSGVTLGLMFQHTPPIHSCNSNLDAEIFFPGMSSAIVRRIDPDGTMHKFAEATVKCHPKDQFSRKVGRRLSLKRVMEHMNLSREDRRAMWEWYFSVAPKDKSLP